MKFYYEKPSEDYLRTAFHNYNFDIVFLNSISKGKAMLYFGMKMYEKFGFKDVLNIDKACFANCLLAIKNCYKNNPYHNYLHGLDTTNSLGFMLINGLSSHLSHLELCSLLFASLCHDIGHPGVNNAFLAASKSSESMICKNSSSITFTQLIKGMIKVY